MAASRDDSAKLSRRQWALLMGSAPLLAQSPAPAPELPDVTAKAQGSVRKASDALAAIEVPMNIEPSFRFSA